MEERCKANKVRQGKVILENKSCCFLLKKRNNSTIMGQPKKEYDSTTEGRRE